MIEERINIVPVIAADISDGVKTITNIFDTISFKKGTEGSFYIDFITNAMINNKYLIKYILFRMVNEEIQALAIDSFVIPPDDDFIKERNANKTSLTSTWSFTNAQIMSSHTTVNLSYDKINLSGSYGVLAFGKKISDDEVIDNNDKFNLEGMELLCEKHFFVNVIE